MTFYIAFFLFQNMPLLFGEGSLSTSKVDYGIAFSPDEKIAYVVRHEGEWGKRDNPPSKIYEYKKNVNEWILVGVSPFSSNEDKYSDSDIFINQNGTQAYFISNRPYSGKEGDGPDVWGAKLSNNKWGNPYPVRNVNSSGYESSPVTDLKGDLYFTSIRDDGIGLGDIYISKVNEGGYFDPPELITGFVNSEFGEWNVLVSPDTKWLMFESSGRAEGLSPYGDLYISKKEESGVWGKPRHIKELNTTGSDLNPVILYRSGLIVYASSKKLLNTDVNFYSYPFREIITKEY